jgi:L-threonylcarbamoyladenylate synthase
VSATVTRVLTVDRDRPDPAALEEAADVLRRGGLVAFPTETVYGLGADATNPEAVARIFEAKGRPSTNPLIVHGYDIKMIRMAVASWPVAAARSAHRFWPGPFSMVLPRSALIPDIVTGGGATVGVRIPDCQVALSLIAAFGRPVAAPSANRSNRVSPTTAAHVLGDLDGRIDLILDAGPNSIGIESTVLDLTTDPPRLLRPGAITVEQIGRALNVQVTIPSGFDNRTGEAHSSPGQLPVHYAPRTMMLVVATDEVPTSWVGTPPAGLCGLIVAGYEVPIVPGVFDRRVDWLDPTIAARELYETLHRWDDGLMNGIYVVLPPDDDTWRAMRDRLWRASRPWARGDRAAP